MNMSFKTQILISIVNFPQNTLINKPEHCRVLDTSNRWGIMVDFHSGWS